jgi:pimeloyl-ACP methyl ester carboxylesterase
MELLREHFERAWQGVIAPTRYSYNMNSIFAKEERIQGHLVERIDLNILNDEGKSISAVIIKEKNVEVRDAVLYFHGNGGTKIEIMGAIPQLVAQQIALIAFDFVGCGNSDQGFLTYGHNEAADAEVVLREAYRYITVERLTVWGRSMGAVTAINFAVKNPKIVTKLILDSPFRRLTSVIKRVVT